MKEGNFLLYHNKRSSFFAVGLQKMSSFSQKPGTFHSGKIRYNKGTNIETKLYMRNRKSDKISRLEKLAVRISF